MDILQCLNEDYEPMSFRLTGMKTIKNFEKLNKIAKWMMKNATVGQIVEQYAKVRSENILKALISLVDQQKKIDKEKNSNTRSAFLSALKKATGRNEKLDSDPQKDGPMNQALLQLSGFLILSQLETDVCTLIFEEVKEVAIVVRETLVRPLKAVLERCTATVENYDGSFQGILSMAKFSLKNSNQLQTLAENVNEGQLYLNLNKNVFRKSSNLISDFIDKLNNDHNRFVPEDGNVHQVTANTINFLKMLAKNKTTVGQILEITVNNSRGADTQFSKLFGGFSLNIVLCLIFTFCISAQVLAALGVNLKNKAVTYQDEFLSALFMLNNLNYVHNCLQDDSIQSILAEQYHQLSDFYKNEISDYLSRYLRSWTRVTSVFAVSEFADEKRAVRTCFTVGF